MNLLDVIATLIILYGAFKGYKKGFFISLMGFISLYLRYKTKDIKSISDYQKFFETIVINVVKTTIDDLKISGLDNLDPNKGYLFISNHRDITLDSALLNQLADGLSVIDSDEDKEHKEHKEHSSHPQKKEPRKWQNSNSVIY